MFALFSFTLHLISGSKEKKIEDVTDQVPSSEEKMKMVLTAHDVRQRTVHKLRQHMGYRWFRKCILTVPIIRAPAGNSDVS